MERDRLIPGNILFSDYHTLQTTDWINATIVHDFMTIDSTSITYFVQTSVYEIVFAEGAGSCLKLFNRMHGQVHSFAGDCQQEGIRDGINPLFTRLSSIIPDNHTPCVLYVIDHYYSAVRMVTKYVMPYVATLIKRYDRGYADLTRHPDGKFLYITHFRGLELFNLVTNTSTDIISASTYLADNAMMYDSNIESFVDMIMLQNNFIIIADYDRNMLYLIDLTTNSTSTICTGVEGYRSGNTSFCQVNRPRSLLQLNGDIYVGEYGAISVFEGRSFSKSGLLIPTLNSLRYHVNLLENTALYCRCYLSVKTPVLVIVSINID